MIQRRRLVWVAVGFGFVFSFTAGLYAGVIVGVDQFLKMDSSAKASVLTYQLRALRGGHVDKIIQAKEIEVDDNVVSALAFQESGMPWLFWPYMGAWDHARYLRNVAEYRKEYPPVVPKLQPPAGTQDPSDLRGFAREVEQSTKVLLERYGK